MRNSYIYGENRIPVYRIVTGLAVFDDSILNIMIRSGTTKKF